MLAQKRMGILHDAAVALSVCLMALLGAMYKLDLFGYDLSLPIVFGSGDSYTAYANGKLIGESGWFFFNNSLGAPFGSNNIDFTANLLMNFDNLITKTIYAIAQNPILTINIQNLLFFPFAALCAFYVLRSLKINRFICAFGALNYAWLAYIFIRLIGHYSLAACYFVPLSILLCIWAYSREDYFTFDKGFFKKPCNVLSIVFCILIANNGIGYYAVFTCFFLLITGLFKSIRERDVRAAKNPAILILIICLSLMICLIPSFVYHFQFGTNQDATVRSPANSEMFGLKIIQFFIPLYAHGIDWLDAAISNYNTNVLLVNENVSAYLGVIGCLGFILSLLYLFVDDSDKPYNSNLELFSHLNLFAVLFATIGGFSSIFFFIIDGKMRGFNRISVFIAFISICFVCILVQRFIQNHKFKNAILRNSNICFICIILFACAWWQIPFSANIDRSTIINSYQSNDLFIKSIESQVEENSMIYELPYSKYPEMGPINSMADYTLLEGYLHSSTLRWSYGAIKGRASDNWFEKLSQQDVPTLVQTLAIVGYNGIMIDTRAYNDDELDELVNDLSLILGEKPLQSNNGNLLFFNLSSYHTNYISSTTEEERTLQYDNVMEPYYLALQK